MDIPKPRGICDACQVGAPSFKHSSGHVAIYCEHHRTAGVLQETADGQVWSMFTPVSREEFTDQLVLFAERFQRSSFRPC